MVSDTVNIFVNNSVVIMRVLRMGSFFFPWLLRSAFYIFCYTMTSILHYKQSIYTPFPLCYSRNRKKGPNSIFAGFSIAGMCLFSLSFPLSLHQTRKKETKIFQVVGNSGISAEGGACSFFKGIRKQQIERGGGFKIPSSGDATKGHRLIAASCRP